MDLKKLKEEGESQSLKGLLSNPMIKGFLLKKLKSAWKENSLQMITITEKNGELEFNVYTEPMTILTQTDFKNIITS